VPRVLRTLGTRTLPSQTNINAAKTWILSRGWALTGAETADELAALNEAFENTATFLAAMREPLTPYWLVLLGVSGTGKTKLAKAISEYMTTFGEALYRRTVAPTLPEQSMKRVLLYAQSGPWLVPWREMCPFSDEARARMRTAQEDWFKVIDELKPETDTENAGPKTFEANAMGNLLDSRLGKWTVVTTNFRLKEIAKWDVRISSRLIRDGADVVDCDGSSVVCDLSGVRDFALRRREVLAKTQPVNE
jgi:hypothetical protein